MKNINNTSVRQKAILIGIGNLARQDDGLGWAFLERIGKLSVDFDLQYKYQLQIEDAELISNYDLVIFIDASRQLLEQGFSFELLRPDYNFQPYSHMLHPSLILYLCDQLFHRVPQAYFLTISGYEWELQTGLTAKASTNLNNAVERFLSFQNGQLLPKAG